MQCWFVAFSARRNAPDAPRWLHGLHRGYQHVFAYRELEIPVGEGRVLKHTLIVNQVGAAMQCDVAPISVAQFAQNLAKQGRWVLMDIRPVPPLRPYLRGPMTCVETVKSLLGIRSPWILTPRQLSRRLRRDGAIPVYPIPEGG